MAADIAARFLQDAVDLNLHGPVQLQTLFEIFAASEFVLGFSVGGQVSDCIRELNVAAAP